MNDGSPQLILASSSPRRVELLRAAGISFRMEAAGVEESTRGSALDLVEYNARQKAVSVAEKFPDCVVLGADTLVALGTKVLGKPSTREEAVSMLWELSGVTHEVLTGVCLYRLTSHSPPIERTFVESTRVTFHSLTRERMDAAFARYDPLDKAGAYAAQEDHGLLIASIEGDVSNVIGLPVNKTLEELRIYFGIYPASFRG
jgi:septum formation protein